MNWNRGMLPGVVAVIATLLIWYDSALATAPEDSDTEFKRYVIIGGLMALSSNHWGPFGAAILTESGHGFVAEFHMNWRSPTWNDNYYSNISVHKAENIFGDALQETHKDYVTINLAYAHAFDLPGNRRALIPYAGLGYSGRAGSRRYYDRTEILGRHGSYWIDDPSMDKNSLNIVAGVIAPLFTRGGWKVSVLVAGETEPSGVILGAGARW